MLWVPADKNVEVACSVTQQRDRYAGVTASGSPGDFRALRPFVR